jgi:hypothetical protein
VHHTLARDSLHCAYLNAMSKDGHSHLNLETFQKQPRDYTLVVPTWTTRQHVQTPKPGYFDVKSLTWKLEYDNGLYHKVAAIPEQRLANFVAGEEQRGETTLKIRGQYRQKPSLRLDDRYYCIYEGRRNKQLQDRCNNAQAWASVVESGKCDSVALGDSFKCGCTYHFQVKGYKGAPGVVYIRFTVGKTNAEHGVDPMQHQDSDGVLVHAGRTDHVQHSASVLALVDSHIKARCGTKLIQNGALTSAIYISKLPVPTFTQGQPWSLKTEFISFKTKRTVAAVHQHVLEQLGCPQATCAEKILQLVEDSVHAKDFYISKDLIRHRRDKVQGTLFKLAEQDAESVKLAVRTSPASICVISKLCTESKRNCGRILCSIKKTLKGPKNSEGGCAVRLLMMAIRCSLFSLLKRC